MKTLLIALLGMLAPYAAGASDGPAYVFPYNWKTAQQVVETLTEEPLHERDNIERDLMHHYVNGIKDGTQGLVWCFKGAILPHELNTELALAIKKRASPSQRQGNASIALLEELKRRDTPVFDGPTEDQRRRVRARSKRDSPSRARARC